MFKENNKHNYNILILGNGARENAIKENLDNNNHNTSIMETNNFDEIGNYCFKENIDILIPSSEKYLCSGIVDHIKISSKNKNTRVFGPSLSESMIEGSKCFSKKIMNKLNIPTSPYKFYKSFDEIILAFSDYETWDENSAPVIKYSGLASGKGVFLPNTKNDAINAIIEIRKSNPNNWEGVIIEDRLFGIEVSIMAFCNGKKCYLMPQSQDYKRVYDDDKGPNTGGMGSICPVNILDENELSIVKQHMDNVVNELSYVGILYAGIMKTKDGIFFLEFNCRFGDPETQSVLTLLETDLSTIILSCLNGENVETKWKNENAACVVLSHEDYPYKKLDYPLKIEFGEMEKNIKTYFANVTYDKQKQIYTTTGGRVLSVVSTGKTIKKAIQKIYNNIHNIHFDGAYYRRDIGRHFYSKTETESCVKIAVLASGNATCIESLLEKTKNKHVKLFITNNSMSTVFQKATKYNIPCVYVDDKDFIRDKKLKNKYYEKIINIIRLFDIDIIFLAGYMRIIPSILFNEYPTFNIHPSLLPKHSNMKDINVHMSVLTNFDKFTGCTLHRVIEQVDKGAIISQYQMLVNTDSEYELKKSVQELEKRCVLQFILNYTKESLKYTVDVNQGNELVDIIKSKIYLDNGFCCKVPFENSIMGLSTDGCGSKLDIANDIGLLDTIGIDLVAMNVNDLLAGGCKPKYFMDYVAVDKMDKNKCSTIISGIIEGCRIAECSLVGGETAELSGIYRKNKLDLAGFAIGESIIEIPRIKYIMGGCLLYGIPSSGIHSNGYTLVRDILKRCKTPYPIEKIMTPTRIYNELIDIYKKYGEHILGVAHITGGGFRDNIKRILPGDLTFELKNWDFPDIFKWIQNESGFSRKEMLETFNCGYGMVIISNSELDNVGDIIGRVVEC